jgi:hypothetical protein
MLLSALCVQSKAVLLWKPDSTVGIEAPLLSRTGQFCPRMPVWQHKSALDFHWFIRRYLVSSPICYRARRTSERAWPGWTLMGLTFLVDCVASADRRPSHANFRGVSPTTKPNEANQVKLLWISVIAMRQLERSQDCYQPYFQSDKFKKALISAKRESQCPSSKELDRLGP